MIDNDRKEYWMNLAFECAQEAEEHSEVPIGAIITLNDEIIASGYNSVIHQNDPTAHAEIVALRKAGLYLGNYRMPDCCLYVTLEPCNMCWGAIAQSRIKKVFFSAYSSSNKKPHATVEGGILQDKCSKHIKAFFQARR